MGSGLFEGLDGAMVPKADWVLLQQIQRFLQALERILRFRMRSAGYQIESTWRVSLLVEIQGANLNRAGARQSEDG
jgi:hypothetical protein